MKIANWTNKKEYPNSKPTPSHQWAWEFLRRNSEYQKDWVLWQKIYAGKNWKPACRKRNIKETLIKKGRIPCLEFLANSYGLRHLMEDPKTPNPCLTFSLLFNHWPKRSKLENNDELMPEDELEVAFRFHLHRPLAPQLKNAGEWLRYEKKLMGLTKKRVYKEHLQNYLRLLDAQQAGATYQKMAEILYPPNKKRISDPDYDSYQEGIDTVKNHLRAAKLLRDKEYISLAYKG
jgi:hypothetical protein